MISRHTPELCSWYIKNFSSKSIFKFAEGIWIIHTIHLSVSRTNNNHTDPSLETYDVIIRELPTVRQIPTVGQPLRISLCGPQYSFLILLYRMVLELTKLRSKKFIFPSENSGSTILCAHTHYTPDTELRVPKNNYILTAREFQVHTSLYSGFLFM